LPSILRDPEPLPIPACPGGARPARRGWLLVGLVLPVTAAVLWRSFNAPPGTIGLEFPFDLIFYYFPMLEQASERLRQGELPLWNPYQCCGVPFLATAQVAVFYPPTWLSLVMPVTWAVKTLMFGQVLAAGGFAVLFFRSLGRGLFAATVGGMLFMFGCILGQIYWPSEVSTLVWLPFLMWCGERFVQTGAARWWALFTVGVAMQALAGFPQFMVYTFYLLAPYVLVRLVWAGPGDTGAVGGPLRSRIIRQGGALAAGCALAAGLAAVQLAPTVELVRNTARRKDLGEQAVHYLEAERGKYLTLRGFCRNVFDPQAKMITFDFPDGTGYLGMSTPLLVAIGLLLAWRDPRIRFFVVVAGVTFILAFGYSHGSAWLYRIYARLPTGTLFRTPSRFLLLTYFSLITIGVFGLDRVSDGLRELRGRAVLRGGVALVMLAFLWVAREVGGECGLRLAAAGASLVILAYLGGERPAILRAVRGLVILLFVLDLANATAPYGSLRDIPVEWGRQQHWGGVSPVRPADLAQAIGQAGLGRIALPGLRPTKTIEPPSRFYMVTEYEPLLPERWCRLNLAMGGEPGFVMSMIDPSLYAPFYNMAGVVLMFRTRISELARERMGPKQWEIHNRLPRRPPAGMQAELRNSAGLPRAYLVGQYELCRPAEALDRFMRADYDYFESVLLEEPPGIVLPEKRVKRRTAVIRSYAPERVVIRTRAAESRLLVLSDTYFPGWKAFVDGVETKILRANYLFRAVSVPEGVHEVVFEYQPSSFRAGLAVSVLSIILFAGITVVGWSRRPRAASPGH
jgi:hypothetical protein